ncbi:secretory phospholipase A2 receptor-like [Hydractinia symbiolongicarpus]|uniref:secretory phospholipase A2 receptor-like n=1 Tax=Hydractinia symbiolongicarpus TaxID=13093 RepID=UPI00254EE062|nr:secretory phospholipase A2 receptor-like [Hydractinia symbiolongicarpus]
MSNDNLVDMFIFSSFFLGFCSYLVSLKTLDGNCVGDNDATFHTAPSINGSCCHANGTNVLFYYAGFKLKNDMGKYLDVNGYREKLEWKGWSMHTFVVLSNLNKKLKWYNTNFCLHMDTNFTLVQCDSANILLEDCFSHSFSTYVAQTSKNLGISAIYSNLPTSDGVNCLSFDLNGVVNTKQEHLPEQCCAYTTNILTYDNYMTFKSLRTEAFLGINFQNMPWTIENIEKTNALENSEEEVKNYFFISSKGDVKPHQLPFCLEYNSTSEKVQVLKACQNSLKFQSCEPEVLYPSISTWYVSTTSWYTTIYEPHKWQDARSMCQMLDAELASVEHFLEFNKINQVIKANNFVYWVGLELNISATWSWTDSSLLITEYLPVGSFGSCGAYETPGDSFISKNCDLNLPFICKKSGSTFYHDFNSCNEAQGWKQFNNHCYKEMKELLTWSDSQMICEMIGGSLVVIKNACEDEFINTMLNSSKEYWIGLSKNFTDGGYLTTWVDGTNISYSNFAVPKRLLTYNNFNFYVNHTGYWFEQIQDRTTKKSFVCQKTIPHYKLYTTPSTWDQAKATCERHDSHLISILNADENLFIHRLTAGYDSNFFWTGGFRQSSAEEYTWLNGKNMTYENWYFKSSYTPRCVLYVRSVSRWRTEVCSQKAPFICAAGGYVLFIFK